MAKGGFDNDIKVGEKFELETVAFLNKQNKNCNYEKIPGYFLEYDLICKHCNTKIECKYDIYGQHTGNFFFERKLLEFSTCDYLYQKTQDDRIYVFRFKDLKEVLRLFWRDGMRYIEAKNADNSEGMIVPIDSLRGIWHIENYEQSGNEYKNAEVS